MIEALNISKHYGEKVALEGVSFTVEQGAVCGLLGPNGAGKTTAIKILLGLLRPDSGAVTIDGRAPGVGSVRDIGFALAGSGLDGGLRVADQLKLVALQHGTPETAARALETNPRLHGLAKQRIKTLSMGQRQAVALAVATLGNPSILILDEPTTGLDAEAIAALRTEVRAFADDGGTVLVSSHLLFELQQSVEQVVILNRTVRYTGPLSTLLEGHESLEQAYFALVTGETRVPAEVLS